MRLLCTADLHIGRRSSRLPSEVRGAAMSTAECWRRIVDTAVTEGVDAVLLAGDVVDEEHKYFAALGPLERGVRRLAREGITTIAVAGNHDYDVLPALVREMDEPHFRCIGQEGWERVTLVRGSERLHVDGWSFPSRHHPGDPLAGNTLDGDTVTPTVGLLHCDLDAAGSRYAPISLSALRARAPVAWVLGHVHSPRLRADGGPLILYPGSPQALDPGEPGPHGAWILEVDGRQARAHPHLHSSVRYERIDLDVEDAPDAAAVRSIIARGVRTALAGVAEQPGALEHLSLRIRLIGRTPAHGEMDRLISGVADDRPEEGGVVARVERVENATAPAYDLAELARGQDAPGVLAALILSMRAGDLAPEQRELLTEIERRIDRVRGSAAYLPVQDRAGPQVPSREMVERRALRLLDTLLRQREAA